MLARQKRRERVKFSVQFAGGYMVVQITQPANCIKRKRTSRKQVRVTNTPLTPLLYSKTGVYRGFIIFLFLLQNTDCGYSLEPPQ